MFQYKLYTHSGRAKRIQLTTWEFPSEITTSEASVTAAITKPAKPYPAPSSITLFDLRNDNEHIWGNR